MLPLGIAIRQRCSKHLDPQSGDLRIDAGGRSDESVEAQGLPNNFALQGNAVCTARGQCVQTLPPTISGQRFRLRPRQTITGTPKSHSTVSCSIKPPVQVVDYCRRVSTWATMRQRFENIDYSTPTFGVNGGVATKRRNNQFW